MIDLDMDFAEMPPVVGTNRNDKTARQDHVPPSGFVFR